MTGNHVGIIHREVYDYPSVNSYYRPHACYPEYLFKDDISNEDNKIYDMVRECFGLLGLDATNYGKPEWNPLGKYVLPGNSVLIKPNFVMHKNGSGNGMDCLITHPAVIAAVIDYVLIALRGKGKLIIGDAPIQDCHFNEMIENGGILPMLAFYKKKGIDISLLDFRNVKRDCVDGVYNNQDDSPGQDEGIVVKMDEGDSAFDGLSDLRIKNLRVTNYDPRIMNIYHKPGRHEYKINRNVLNADVVINMPKPKTHRYGGITCALKNVVGINANKEMLPHHTVGGKADDGDCSEQSNKHLMEAHRHIDALHSLTIDGKLEEAAHELNEYERCLTAGKKEVGEHYWFGGWHGNDTIWRTIADLNKIFYYADKNGKICDTVQRKVFIVADMICGGDHNGPLSPSPVKSGTIAMGDDPLAFDKVICSVMGFDWHMIPQLNNDWAFIKGKHPVSTDGGKDVYIISNDVRWNQKKYEEIRLNSVHYQSEPGWEPVLGYNDDINIKNEILNARGVYIFGFGRIGRMQADTMIKWGIKPNAFLDNDDGKWGDSYNDIICMSPYNADIDLLVIIAIKSYETIKLILNEVDELGFSKVMIWNTKTKIY